jgi:ribosomal protein L29
LWITDFQKEERTKMTKELKGDLIDLREAELKGQPISI